MIASRISRRRAPDGVVAGTALAIGSRRALALGEPIRIGLPLTTSGGIDGRSIELVTHDGRANAQAMIGALRELAGQGINLKKGDPLPVSNLATAPILPQLDVVYVTSATIAIGTIRPAGNFR